MLLVEDDKMVAESVIGLLEDTGAEIVHASDLQTALGLLKQAGEFDLVVSDYSLGAEAKGDEVLRVAQALQPKARRILMSGELEAGRFTGSGEAQVFLLKTSKLGRGLKAEIEALAVGTPAL